MFYDTVKLWAMFKLEKQFKQVIDMNNYGVTKEFLNNLNILQEQLAGDDFVTPYKMLAFYEAIKRGVGNVLDAFMETDIKNELSPDVAFLMA